MPEHSATEGGLRLLDSQWPKLHTSEEVEAVVKYVGSDVADTLGKLSTYVNFLADTSYVNWGIMNGGEENVDQAVDANVLQPEWLRHIGHHMGVDPRLVDAMRDREIQICVSERGILSDNTWGSPEHRSRVIEAIQRRQGYTLAKWGDHLGTSEYPDWFKLYAWESVTSSRISRHPNHVGTLVADGYDYCADFPSLDETALSRVYSAIEQRWAQGVSVESDSKLDELATEANFIKLYAYSIQQKSD